MIIKASTALRNEYSTISELAHETKEPIYITKNGEGDIVLMDIDAFESLKDTYAFRARVLQAENERLSGCETVKITEVRRKLKERLNGI